MEFGEKNIADVVRAVVEAAGIAAPKMTLKLAAALIQRVEERAVQMGLAVVIAVCDGGANPVAVHRMDGAYIGSFDIAVNKTFTSVGFQTSTAQLGRLCQPGQPLYGVQYTNGGKVVILGGGEPLRVNGNIIGALGVSGASADEDTALAAYGKDILMEVVECL